MCDALKALAEAAIAAMDPQPDPLPTVYTAKDNSDKTLPAIICEADGSGEEDPPSTGNFWVTAGLSLRHTAVDDGVDGGEMKANDQAILTALSNAIFIDSLAADLSAAVDDFTVFPNSENLEAPHRDQIADGVWEDTIQFKALCCASDL